MKHFWSVITQLPDAVATGYDRAGQENIWLAVAVMTISCTPQLSRFSIAFPQPGLSIIAILAKRPDSELYIRAISQPPYCRMSAGNFVELAIMIEGQFGMEVARQCDALFLRVGIVIEPVTVEQAYLARQAFHDFGKGRHPAGLNFGDCFAYALAKSTGEPLLFKGQDFRKTDIAAAI